MDSLELEMIADLTANPIIPAHDSNASLVPVATVEAKATRDEFVMIVDDEPSSIAIVRKLLEEEQFTKFLTTTDSSEAVELVRHHQPDVVLLNLAMPKVDGIQILQEIRGDDRICNIPVMVVTASSDPATRERVINAGSTDFLIKPVNAAELVFRIEKALELQRSKMQLAELSGRLESQVKSRTKELLKTRQEAIRCLARAAEYRDDDTGQHVVRVGKYAAVIASELGFPKPAVDLIEQAAQLHDIGKIGIPDSILHKPGKLDNEEYACMKRHCGIGRQIICSPLDQDTTVIQHRVDACESILGSATSPVLRMAAQIAGSHHEKWDGTGYPLGLAGEAIPLEGRIVAVADVFDALASKRPYKEAFPLDKCLSIIRDGRGKHFDPRVLDAFFTRMDDVTQIYQQFADPSGPDSIANAISY